MASLETIFVVLWIPNLFLLCPRSHVAPSSASQYPLHLWFLFSSLSFSTFFPRSLRGLLLGLQSPNFATGCSRVNCGIHKLFTILLAKFVLVPPYMGGFSIRLRFLLFFFFFSTMKNWRRDSWCARHSLASWINIYLSSKN